jgi:flagellar protein FlbD
MIELNRLDDSKILLNSEQIESIEQTPDTVITLTNGKKIIVKDNAREVLKRIISFKLESIQKKFKSDSHLKSVVSL